MHQPPQLNTNALLDSSPLSSPQLRQTFVLSVSNLHSKYRLKYGAEFKDMLDARDQVMAH